LGARGYVLGKIRVAAGLEEWCGLRSYQMHMRFAVIVAANKKAEVIF